MGKAEPNCCWDDVVDEASKDEKFDNILDILDFPIESLEDDEFVGDWDVSKSLCLGPIPSDVLMAPPAPPVEPKIDTGPLRQPVAKIGDGTSDAQEPNASQMQSPISVLESSGSHSAEKGLLITSRTPPIPVGTRSKRVRPSAEPWFLRSPFLASKTTKERRNKRDSTRKAKNLIFEESDSIVEPQNTSCATKKCSHCEVTKTPQWREGPAGPKTLCNACGVRFRSGRLFPEYRPAASPTFVPSIHSNSHRKVIEMRNKGKQKASGVEITPISPEIEFIHMNNSYLFDSV